MSMASSLTEDEKKRLLRERRQAKMSAKGTDRLNKILTSGSSLKSTTSPVETKLNNPRAVDAETNLTKTNVPIPENQNKTLESVISNEDDPEDIDISKPSKQDDGVPDIDAILKSMLGGMGSEGTAAPSNNKTEMPGFAGGGANGADPFAMLKNMMSGDQSFGVEGEQPHDPKDEYNTQMLAYTEYQQKRIKFAFLVARYGCILMNFIWHYSKAGLISSSHNYIREISNTNGTNSFFVLFITIEIIILSLYFFVSAKMPHIMSGDRMIMKLIQYASLVVPQVNQYRPLILQYLGYWDIFSLFLGDISFVIVLFALMSFKGNI